VKLFLVVPLCCAGLFAVGLSGMSVARSQPAEADAWKDCKYENASACTRCHVQPTGNDFPSGDPNKPRALDIVLLTEYAVWKTHDKHAQAYAVLEGPRAQRMGELLGQAHGKKVDVTKKEAGCLACHAMGNLAADDRDSLDMKDGVSCGGCHGPSSKWNAEHAKLDYSWRKKTPEEKFKLGMRDLRDPEVRSQLCMSCHVGNAAEGKVVTHAMFAAGHPPLPPFEIATFSKNEPPHWRENYAIPHFKNAPEAVVKNYHLQNLDYHATQLALVGSVVALRETAKLAAARADLKADNPARVWPELVLGFDKEPDAGALRQLVPGRWPELAMAHSDCFGCHHDLKYPGFRQERGFGYRLAGFDPIRAKPGRPVVRAWPTVLIEAGTSLVGKKEDLAGLDKRLRALVQAGNARPFGTPADVARTTADVAAWCDTVLPALKETRLDQNKVLKLMQTLCATYGEESNESLPDYESAKQIASLLLIAFGDWQRNGGKAPAAATVHDALTEQLNLAPYSNRPKRLEVVFKILEKERGGELKGKEQFLAYLKDIGSLDAIKKLNMAQDFLNTVRGISNDNFNDRLVKDHIKVLQQLSDEEETATLRAVETYDPQSFKKNLRAFAAALPAAQN
jgi:hypothetical protein